MFHLYTKFTNMWHISFIHMLFYFAQYSNNCSILNLGILLCNPHVYKYALLYIVYICIIEGLIRPTSPRARSIRPFWYMPPAELCFLHIRVYAWNFIDFSLWLSAHISLCWGDKYMFSLYVDFTYPIFVAIVRYLSANLYT